MERDPDNYPTERDPPEPTDWFAEFSVRLYDRSLDAALAAQTDSNGHYPTLESLVRRCVAHGLRQLGHELDDEHVEVILVDSYKQDPAPVEGVEAIDPGEDDCTRECPDCRGTGRNPMSDNVNWLPCTSCGGRGAV